MFFRHLHNLKLHPDSNGPLIPRTTQDPKTRLPLDPFIYPSITNVRIPGLILVLPSYLRINIRDLTPRTSRLNIITNPSPMPNIP